MDERSSKRKKRDHDFSINAFRVVQEATSADETDTLVVNVVQPQSQQSDGKNPNAVALGRLGGKKGGKARAQKLTAEQRSAIARKAAQARWGNRTTE